ncbi:MAG: hypothetical protein IKX33_10140 [Prevotella sp.]|nr:hypothetical protein [Prevotella sp.]
MKTLHVGVQWMVTAGIGLFCVGYSYNLTPLFKLPDGANAYPSSLTFGVDVWYFFPISFGKNRSCCHYMPVEVSWYNNFS